MPTVPEKISELSAQRDRLLTRKRSVQSRLEEIESDLQRSDISDEKKSHLKDLKIDLEEKLENINYSINSTEEDLRNLEGGEEVRTNLNSVAKEAASLLDEVEEGYQEIQKKQDDFKETLEEVDQTHEEIEELEDSVRGLLERSTSAALGEQFAGRKSELESNLRYWRYASIGSIVILLLSSAVIYHDIVVSNGNATSNLSKIALILPISVAVWFSVSNYSRQKRLMEEYEFKARMALSLTGFREVLQKETTEENNDLVAEFVVDTMEKIYSNPQENIRSDGQTGQDDPLTTGQRPLVEVIKKLGNQ